MDEGLEARTLPDSNAQLEGVQQQVDRLQRMVRISRLLSSTLDLDQLLQLIIQTAADMVGSEAASILLEDRRTGGLCFVAATNRSADELRCIEVPVDHSIAGTIYKTGEAAIVDNAMVDPRHYEEVDTRIEFQTRSILGVPLQVRNRNIGVLEAVNRCGGSCFSQEDVEILQTLASQAAVAIQNAKLVDDLRQANTRLAQIDKIKSDFLSIASHELRTPLNLVMGYAAMLREDASGR
jgi:sigma-B regulation protein RsbU (phosphoserine phosphatase)